MSPTESSSLQLDIDKKSEARLPYIAPTVSQMGSIADITAGPNAVPGGMDQNAALSAP